jgi:hypothetical protein
MGFMKIEEFADRAERMVAFGKVLDCTGRLADD